MSRHASGGNLKSLLLTSGFFDKESHRCENLRVGFIVIASVTDPGCDCIASRRRTSTLLQITHARNASHPRNNRTATRVHPSHGSAGRPTLQELLGAIAAQGIAPTGPWFTHHLRRPAETFDFEVSVTVLTAIKAAGRVQPSEWPAMKVARTVYHGGFEGLGDAWSELLDWIEANGHRPTGDLWERYTVGPEASDNPADWRTELTQPLLG